MNSKPAIDPFDVHAVFANSAFCVRVNVLCDTTLPTFMKSYAATLGFVCTNSLAERTDNQPSVFIVVGNTPATRSVFYNLLSKNLPVQMLISEKDKEPLAKYSDHVIRLNLPTDNDISEFIDCLCSAKIEMVPNTSSVLYTEQEKRPFDRKFWCKEWKAHY